MKQNEFDFIMEKANNVNGINTYHLNNDFAKYCDLFIEGGYDNFPKGQIRLRNLLNKLEKQGLIWSEWGGTGLGGEFNFGVKRYKTWYTIQNKWNKK